MTRLITTNHKRNAYRWKMSLRAFIKTCSYCRIFDIVYIKLHNIYGQYNRPSGTMEDHREKCWIAPDNLEKKPFKDWRAVESMRDICTKLFHIFIGGRNIIVQFGS